MGHKFLRIVAVSSAAAAVVVAVAVVETVMVKEGEEMVVKGEAVEVVTVTLSIISEYLLTV